MADEHKLRFCTRGKDGVFGPQALLNCMQLHVAVPPLQQQAAGAIASLAMHPQNKAVLGAIGAVTTVLNAMRAHKKAEKEEEFLLNAQVHEECCSALRNLAANHAGNKETIANEGGIDEVIASMQLFLASAPNQLHGAGALWNIPANNTRNKLLVVSKGGIHVLLDAMRKHKDDADVVQECTGALRNLSTCADNKTALLERTIVSEVIQAMRLHPAVPLLQEQAAALLFNLANNTAAAAAASSSSATPAETPAQLLYSLGALDVVLASLQAHLASSSVVEECCACLWILGSSLTSVSWDNSLKSSILSLAEQASTLHGGISTVMNFVQGMKSAWEKVKLKA